MKCMDCNSVMEIGVYKSAAGYYIGYWCNNCGPYDRVSGYYPTKEAAEKELPDYQ